MKPIAIIGIGCRFPGAADAAAFWRLLRDGVDAVGEIPPERWDSAAYYDPDRATPGKMSTRWGGFLDQVDQFDPRFFKISRREAAHLDPQQRLLLELAWETFEDAGQVGERLAGSQTGVFIGIGGDDYGRLQWGNPAIIDAYTNTGCAMSIAANRLSYVFDLRGPSLALDTACSASLVAVHLACQSIWNGDSTQALAGGVNLILTPEATIGFSKLAAMAPDGRCKAFDASGNGYVRGEGAGLVLLKPLDQAQADGDPIYAVIRGSAVNQDGRTNGLTAPNRWAQEAVLREAYARADVAPGLVQYVETHGTGTFLGDPIEAKALGAVLTADRPPETPCAIGSVKTNIGHLETAAGIAGLIKVALMLHHRELPPSLHFATPNPHIPFEALQLRVQQTLEPWPAHDGAVFAGVSSFSFGGTNAHIVLESAPPAPQPIAVPHAERAYLLPLSAHTPETLQALARSFAELPLEEIALADLCYSASARRSHHQQRLALVTRSVAQLRDQLSAVVAGQPQPGIASGTKPGGQRHKIVFVFPGQGSQWFGMARTLLEHEPVFRHTLAQCEEAMQRYVDWSLLEQLQADPDESRLRQIDVIQPTLWAIEVGLAALWRAWGIEPDAVVGHSMGEVAAAHVAGVLSLDDAARIICCRSKLLRRVSGQGVMAVVELSHTDAEAALVPYAGLLSVAAINNPRSTVLSGDAAAMQALIATLEQQEIFCRLIKVDVASHSPQMDPLCADLLQVLDGIQPRVATVPIFSTVLGALSDGTPYSADYWMRNLREPVLFAPAIHALRESGHDIFIELSPHPILLSAIEQGLRHHEQSGTVLPSFRREEPEQVVMLESLAALYTLGHEPRWEQVYPAAGRVVPLPVYPWQRERFWIEQTPATQHAVRRDPSGHPLLGPQMQASNQPVSTFWELALDPALVPYLTDHCIQGAVVVPATAYLEIVLAAAQTRFGPGAHVVEQVALKQMLILRDDAPRTMQLVISADGDERATFQVASRLLSAPAAEPWTVHTIGSIRLNADSAQFAPAVALDTIRARCTEQFSGAEFYGAMQRLGFEYGPTFQGVTEVAFGGNEAVAPLRLAEAVAADSARYRVHPTILDACFQLLGTTQLWGPDRVADGETYLPVGLERLEIHGGSSAELWGYARLHTAIEGIADAIEGDVFLLDRSGAVVVAALGVRMQRLNRVGRSAIDEWLYRIEWEPQQAALTESATRGASGSWLILADQRDTSAPLVAELSARGDRVVVATPGAAFARSAPDRYQLDPGTPDHFRQLLADAFQRGAPACVGVVDLWSLDAAPPSTTGPAFAADQEIGWSSALHLTQALAQAGWRDLPRLWLVTSGVQPIDHSHVVNDDNQSTIALSQAPLWGLARAIGHEHPTLRCTRIDLSAAHGTHEAETLARLISADDREEDSVLRGDQRYVARLVRATLPEVEPSAAPLFRADATYLISGGLGGLGLTVARWLVTRGARQLVLLGRSAPGEAAQAVLQELRAIGAQIMVAQADVAQADQLDRVLADVRLTLPPLRGIVHAAGVMDDGIVLRLDRARFHTVLAPKAGGAWNLHTLTLDDPLDHFILFSSAAGLLGSPGQGNYAAANAFLDALAHARQATGRPALSINWGPWAEVGLAARPDRGGRLAAQGIVSITPPQGVAVLERLLGQQIAQIAAMPLSLRQWFQFYPKSAKAPLFTHLAAQQQAQSSAGSEQAIRDAIAAAESGQARLLVVEDYLREQIAQVLRLPVAEITADTQFKALGFDSLLAMELRNRLEASLSLQLSATLIWTYPTTRALATHLATKIDPPSSVAPVIEVVPEPQDEPLAVEEHSADEWAELLARELENIA